MPTWSTATEWDNSQSSQYVVHESIPNTDHVNDDWYYQGYNYSSPEIAPSYLEALYPLHEDSGSTAYDVSNNNDLTTYNVTKGEEGLLKGSSYSFNGFNSYCESSGPILPDVTSGGFAIAAWIKTDDTAGTDTIIVNRTGSTSDSWVSIENIDGDFAVSYRSSSSGSISVYNTGSSIGDNSWHMVLATFDTFYEELTTYIDGNNVGTYTDTQISDDWLFNSESTTLTFGNDGSGSYNYIGNLSNVFVYSVDLINNSVDTLYNTVNSNGTYTTSKKSL